MATAIFCRRILRIHHLSRFKRGLIWVRNLHNQTDVDAENLDDSDGASQPKDETKLAYRLYYNPASYCHLFNLQTLLSQNQNDEDEPCLSTLTPCYWQQGNTYSVSSSRRLRSKRNTLLDLVFNKIPETELQVRRYQIPPDVGFDPRAFLKCRPEYLYMSLNFTQRPTPTPFNKFCELLQKVADLKGSMKPSDVSSIIWELSCVDEDKIALVRGDPRFIILLRYSVENLQLYSLCQLLQILQAFVWLEMPSDHTVLDLCESELSHRADQMTLHQLLFAADLWRCIGKHVPQFLQSLYTSVPLYVDQIRTPELVQLLYIIGEGRHCPTHLIQTIEKLLMQHLHDLKPEEIGTVSLGLFKSQTSLSERAVMHIVDKAHSFVENMSNPGLVNVMKYLRFSHLFHKDWLEAMETEVPKRKHKMNIQELMHVSLACSSLHYRNDNILLSIAETVPSLVPNCRIKDSAKLLWAFGTLGFLPVQSPNLYTSLTEGLRQCKAEFHRYPEHLLTGLLGLAFVSIFPEDLLAFALSPEFVKLALSRTHQILKRDLYTLDGIVELELPDWTGPRLSSKLKEETSDMLWKLAKSDVCQKQEVVEAEVCLKDLLGGEEFVCKKMILPYMRTIDLEVHLDSNAQPLPVMLQCNTKPEKMSTKKKYISRKGKAKHGVTLSDDLVAQLVNTKSTKSTPKFEPLLIHRVEPDEDEKLFDTGVALTNELTEMKSTLHEENNSPVKLAIQVSSRNHYCYHSDQMLGFQVIKRRHLKLAGYKVIELHHDEWFPLLRRSRTEKLAYLHCKVFSD